MLPNLTGTPTLWVDKLGARPSIGHRRFHRTKRRPFWIDELGARPRTTPAKFHETHSMLSCPRSGICHGSLFFDHIRETTRRHHTSHSSSPPPVLTTQPELKNLCQTWVHYMPAHVLCGTACKTNSHKKCIHQNISARISAPIGP